MNSILYRYTFELVTNDFIFFEMFLENFYSLDGLFLSMDDLIERI